MIRPHSKGRKVVVRFVGREFEYWNGVGFTPYKRNAVRYAFCEAWSARNKINRSKDFPFKVAVVDEIERLNAKDD